MNTVLFLEFTVENPNLERVVASLEKMTAQLEALEGFQHARALRNTDDPRVFLLESTWNETVPALENLMLEPPPGSVKTRTWTFSVLEPARKAI